MRYFKGLLRVKRRFCGDSKSHLHRRTDRLRAHRIGPLRHAIFDLDAEPVMAAGTEAERACGHAAFCRRLAEGGTRAGAKIGIIHRLIEGALTDLAVFAARRRRERAETGRYI